MKTFKVCIIVGISMTFLIIIRSSFQGKPIHARIKAKPMNRQQSTGSTQSGPVVGTTPTSPPSGVMSPTGGGPATPTGSLATTPSTSVVAATSLPPASASAAAGQIPHQASYRQSAPIASPGGGGAPVVSLSTFQPVMTPAIVSTPHAVTGAQPPGAAGSTQPPPPQQQQLQPQQPHPPPASTPLSSQSNPYLVTNATSIQQPHTNTYNGQQQIHIYVSNYRVSLNYSISVNVFAP